MATIVSNRAKFRIASGALDLDTSDLRVLLLRVTPDAALPAGAIDPDLNTVADLLAVATVVEVSASGYSRQQWTGRSAVEDDANNRAEVTGSTITWSTVATGQTVRGWAIFEEAASDATRSLVAVSDDPNVPTNGSNLTLSPTIRVA